MTFGVIADHRFMTDYRNRGTASVPVWNSPPRYLLGRLISSPHFSHEVTFIPYKPSSVHSCCAELRTCDYGIIHIDATMRPPELLEASKSIPLHFPLVNRYISDIRKSTLHGLLQSYHLMTPDLHPTTDEDTLAFVKSDFNAGDAPKRVYERCRHGDLSSATRKDCTLIVQRFVKDDISAQHQYYRVRRFIIVGQEIIQVEYFSRHFVVKRSTSAWQYSRDIGNLDSDLRLFETPNISSLGYNFRDFYGELGNCFGDMLKFIKGIGFQFGSVDVITPFPHEFYVLDINCTPWERGIPDSLVKILAQSLEQMTSIQS